MGSRGPKELPANVHRMKGNPSKKSAAQLMDSLQPEIDAPDCPSHLLKEAQTEWKRIVPHLKKYGLISHLDRAALAMYCQSWALVVYAETKIKTAMLAADKEQKKAAKNKEVYKGTDGLVIYTDKGNPTYSPYWVIAKGAREQCDKLLANFGLSPSARARVNPSNYLQQNLDFEDTNQTPGNSFSRL